MYFDGLDDLTAEQGTIAVCDALQSSFYRPAFRPAPADNPTAVQILQKAQRQARLGSRPSDDVANTAWWFVHNATMYLLNLYDGSGSTRFGSKAWFDEPSPADIKEDIAAVLEYPIVGGAA